MKNLFTKHLLEANKIKKDLAMNEISHAIKNISEGIIIF